METSLKSLFSVPGLNQEDQSQDWQVHQEQILAPRILPCAEKENENEAGAGH